ncbi:MAG TPA: hypothetical protein VMB34_27235 [Acetobacteraceae bacterium]|nr:hypothetical protein [Acetobacteraceae bacterium]
MAETGALDRLLRLPGKAAESDGAAVSALATASAAIARLDQAVDLPWRVQWEPLAVQ